MKELVWSQVILQKLSYWQSLVIILIIVGSCANPVAPTGGPRDTEPPRIMHSQPENGSINFKEKEIIIWFDEFIQLKGIQQEFLSSPPFQKVPEIRVRGKSLIIKLGEELLPNTTYTLFFGNAISDFNEGNTLPNFRYVLSTGNVLDSMEIAGMVINALTLKPEKEIYVMLYDNYKDSVPYLERPYYLSKTDKNGLFNFTNLRNIPYKIFALRDMNANLIFDLPNEEIAFKNELIYPKVAALSAKDTINTSQDSIGSDQSEKSGFKQISRNPNEIRKSGIISGTFEDSLMILKKHIDLPLYLFLEADSIQRLQKAEYHHPDKLIFTFRLPVRELSIVPIPDFDTTWNIAEFNKTRDTLYYWLTSIDRDSLVLEVSEKHLKADTIVISLVKLNSYRMEKEKDTTFIKLAVRSNISRSNPFHLHESIILDFDEPIAEIRPEMIELLEDSVRIEPEIRFTDEVRRKLTINHGWKDTTNYSLFIPGISFTSIYGHSNDTLHQIFKTRSSSDYANLKINFEHNVDQGQLILVLLDERANILQQRPVDLNDLQANFTFLLPGKYHVRLIHDSNANNHWDSGYYIYKIQPERIYDLGKTIELRGNWDVEETFTVPENDQ